MSLFERIAVVLVPDLLSDSRSGGSRQQDFFPCGQDFLIRKFFLSAGNFFLTVGHFSYRREIFPNRGTFLLSVGEFFRSAGHFSYNRGTVFLSAGHFSCWWDIFPVDRGQNFREGHGNPVCRSPQRAGFLKTPGNPCPQGAGFLRSTGKDQTRQDF